MAESGGIPGTLKPRQHKAIEALLHAGSVPEAAQACGVPERTLYRWLREDADFCAALVAAEGGAIDEAARQLIGAAGTAITTLQGLLTKSASDHVKVRAAEVILSHLLKLRELRNVEARLTALEAVMRSRGQHAGDRA